ncbi:MAG: CDP-alcohol phosphatidyltransferase family protein [Patescibacteria group bacterium]|jgi:phosphatidylglycerophosphate synthase
MPFFSDGVIWVEKFALAFESGVRRLLEFASSKKEAVLIPWLRKNWPGWLSANLITGFRLAAAVLILPWIFWGNYQGRFEFAVAFGLILLTDFLDGLIARATGKESAIGSLMDKIADKLLVVPLGVAEFWPVDRYLIVFSFVGLGIVLATVFIRFFRSDQQVVPENIYGKLSMLLYSLGIVLAIWPQLLDIGRIFGWMGLAFGTASAIFNFRRHFDIG